MSRVVVVAVLKYAPLILLPILIALTTASAARSQGPTRVYWTLGAFGAVVLSGYLSVVRERHAVARRRDAVSARAELATTLTSGTRPLIQALGRVGAGRDLEESRAALSVLISKAVSLTQALCGRYSRFNGKIRTIFYEFDDDRLVRIEYAGREDGTPPRPFFSYSQGSGPERAIRVAQGEDAVLVTDLDDVPPGSEYSHLTGKAYKSLIAVPVRAGETSYGLLATDSDIPGSLTKIDRSYMTFIAEIIGAAYSHIRAMESIPANRARRSTDHAEDPGSDLIEQLFRERKEGSEGNQGPSSRGSDAK